ncbi:MAG: hypothetical protein IKA36_02240, partial [Clostridia bacterium]|nr:hypothetical protein [Clostridia bacterium]
MNGFGMPAPPMYPQQQQYYQQPQYYPQPQQSYAIDNNGAPVQATTYAPSTPAPIMSNRSLGVNFGGLIGTNASVPMVRDTSDDGMVVTSTKKKSPKKKKDDTPAPTSAEIVNATVYADTYAETNNLLRMAIAQADDLATDLKTEFNMIRASRNMKGKYTYLANISAAMSGLISTKVGAIKEINNSIKAGNDAEYRIFKDMRAMDAQDDSKV